jgi:hypothetical protein
MPAGLEPPASVAVICDAEIAVPTEPVPDVTRESVVAAVIVNPLPGFFAMVSDEVAMLKFVAL